MKKLITMSLVAAATTVAFASTAGDIANLQTQIDSLKAKQGKINAHTANDNLKWSADFRTAYDNINYDMANGTSQKNDALLSMRLWLNMAYNPDANNVFMAQLSMNKAFGADFGLANGSPSGDMSRAMSMGGMFDWVGNEALTDNSLKVRQVYWLYLGEEAFGADIPWTFSIGRRPSTGGFLGNLRNDDAAQSPLAHVIDVEFDGLSSSLDLSNITGIPGMNFKVCMGLGNTNAVPMFQSDGTQPYIADDNLQNIPLAGFIFVPYNDGQYIVKTTYYKAWNLPEMTMGNNKGFNLDPANGAINPAPLVPGAFEQVGDIEGAAISVLIDGLTEDGYFSDAKLFGSFAWSKTSPDTDISKSFGQGQKGMLGSSDSETGTSYWVGAQLPVVEGGVFGLEYNHGSQYWRPFTYAEDTMIGSKIAARGDAYEAYFTYQINDALSAQVRYTKINYDYTGSQGFFGGVSGTSMKIDDVKMAAASFAKLDPMAQAKIASDMNIMAGGKGDPRFGAPSSTADEMAMAQAAGMLGGVVETAQDFRFYLRYRF